MEEKSGCCGRVTIEERDEIQRLHMRKVALTELFGAVSPQKSDLYERVVEDMGRTMIAYEGWFSARAKQYDWKSIPGGKWRIDFTTCEVFLE